MRNENTVRFFESSGFELLKKFVDRAENGELNALENGTTELILTDCINHYLEALGSDIENVDDILENYDKIVKEKFKPYYNRVLSTMFVKRSDGKLESLGDIINQFFPYVLVYLKENNFETKIEDLNLPRWILYNSLGNPLSRAKLEQRMLKYIYEQNKATDESYEEFYKSVREHLRNEINAKYLHSENVLGADGELSQEEKIRMNGIREKILSISQHNSHVLDGALVEFEMLYEYIKTCSEIELKTMLNELELSRQEKIEYNENRIAELTNKLNSIIQKMKQETTQEKREGYRNIVEQIHAEREMYSKRKQLYESYADYEWVFPCAWGMINEGKVLSLSSKVSHKFNGSEPSALDKSMQTLIYLINSHEMERLGYWDQNFSFRRKTSMFVDKDGQPISISKKLNKLNINKNLVSINYDIQSNLIFKNYVTDNLDLRVVRTVERSEIVERRNGTTEHVVVECSLLVNSLSGHDGVEGPVYVKLKKTNPARSSMECALFMFIADDPSCAVQLFRAEKTFSLWRNGEPAQHKLYGGETISAYKHLHIHNELDAVSKRERDLGYMDPALVLSEKISDEDFELWFDNLCGIKNSSIIQSRF